MTLCGWKTHNSPTLRLLAGRPKFIKSDYGFPSAVYTLQSQRQSLDQV